MLTVSSSIVVAFRENGGLQSPHLFRSYDNYRWAPQCAIWEVARATSATPLYFKPIKINESRYLDGGIGANNPSRLVLNEVMQMHSESRNPISLLLSISTGTSSRPTSSPLTSMKSVISTQTKDTHKRFLKEKNDINFYYRRFDAAVLKTSNIILGSLGTAGWQNYSVSKTTPNVILKEKWFKKNYESARGSW